LTTAAVILAAGGGSRWDGEGHKLLALVRGRRVVDWAVGAAAAAGLDDLIVVSGAVDLGLDGVGLDGVVVDDVVPNGRWAEGMATSLAAGVAAAEARGHDAVVVGLGDQPGVTAGCWRAVAASTHDLAVAEYPDGRTGHPVRIAKTFWRQLPASGDQGARVLMRERPELVGRVACQGDPADVDTLEDLRAWS
jgi:molybdenum cofactor cytidylyltransferase